MASPKKALTKGAGHSDAGGIDNLDSSYGEGMSYADGDLAKRLEYLYASARAARSRVAETVAQADMLQRDISAAWQLYQQAWARAEQLRELSRSGRRSRLKYSAYARLEARMATMPVIEQAKGIIMAECGWTPDQAFDALRKASQRENIKLRDVAARVVANTARSDGLPRSSAARRALPESGSAADRAVAVKPSSVPRRRQIATRGAPLTCR